MNFSPNRVKYTFGIGADEDVSEFIDRAVELISERTGGLTVLEGRGAWREDGNTEPPYTAPVQSEASHTITFVTSEDSEFGLGDFKDLFRLAQSETGAPVSWIHTEVTPVQCDHFRADMPAVGERHTSGDGHLKGEPVIE